MVGSAWFKRSAWTTTTSPASPFGKKPIRPCTRSTSPRLVISSLERLEGAHHLELAPHELGRLRASDLFVERVAFRALDRVDQKLARQLAFRLGPRLRETPEGRARLPRYV